MKKLLVLALVLSLASVSNAALLQLNGADFSTAAPGAVSITITNTQAISAGGGLEGYFELVTSIGNTIDYSGVVLFSPDLSCDNSGLDDGGWEHPAGTDGSANVGGAILGVFTFGSAYAVGTQLYTGITVNAVAGTKISLYKMQDEDITRLAIPVVPISEITIIPEPMTLALLGLGGLFLRRRK